MNSLRVRLGLYLITHRLPKVGMAFLSDYERKLLAMTIAQQAQRARMVKEFNHLCSAYPNIRALVSPAYLASLPDDQIVYDGLMHFLALHEGARKLNAFLIKYGRDDACLTAIFTFYQMVPSLLQRLGALDENAQPTDINEAQSLNIDSRLNTLLADALVAARPGEWDQAALFTELMTEV